MKWRAILIHATLIKISSSGGCASEYGPNVAGFRNMPLLIWLFNNCRRRGLLHLYWVCFEGIIERFLHSDHWKKHGSSCLLSEAAGGNSYKYCISRLPDGFFFFLFFFPPSCSVWSLGALINQFWGLKWDNVFSILCSAFGKGWRKCSYCSPFCLSSLGFFFCSLCSSLKWSSLQINWMLKWNSKVLHIPSSRSLCQNKWEQIILGKYFFPLVLEIKQSLHYWNFLQINHKQSGWV